MTKSNSGGAKLNMRRLHLTALLLPVFFACDRPAKDAGEIVADSEGGSDPLGEVVDGTVGPGGRGRMLVLPESTRVRKLVRSGDGVLAVTATCCDAPRMRVSELDADMQTLWTLDLGDVGLHHVAPLDDGGWVVTGVSPAGSNDPAIWKLSCCGELESKHEFDDFSQNASGVGTQPLGDGYVFASSHYDDVESPSVRWTFLDEDFDETSARENPLTAPGANPYLRRTPDGKVAALFLGNGTSTVFEVGGPDDVSSQTFDGRMLSVGDGADLGWIRILAGKTTFTPYGGVPMPIAPFGDEIFGPAPADRRSHIALIAEESVVEIAEDGAVLRDLVLPAFSPGAGQLGFAVAVAEDDSIFVGIDELSLSVSIAERAVIHHIPAL